jgi:hypothetical protein
MHQVLTEANLLPISDYMQKGKATLLVWTQNRDKYQQADYNEQNYKTGNIQLWGPDPNPEQQNRANIHGNN